MGRARELQRIEGFFRVTTERNNGLAILHLIGEAGIGKSRLLEEGGKRLVSLGAAVLHARLYPEASGSIISLLSDVITAQLTVHRLLKEPILPEFASVMSGLRRLTRLRPTVLILEDLHLMNAECAAELSTLLQGMSGEPLCLFCASRPADSPGVLTIGPYTLETLRLTPLRLSDILPLFAAFGLPQDNGLAAIVHQSTHGLPLIVRSILTELHTRFSDDTLSPAASPTVTSRIREQAKRLSRAMMLDLTFGLSDSERKAAQRIAAIGEIVSAEAVDILLGNDANSVQSLIEKGVIARSERPYSPFFGNESDASPFIFAHTLLRDQLAAEFSLSIEEYLQIFESNAAIYSLAPVEKVVRLGKQITDPNRLASLVRSLARAAVTLVSSAQRDISGTIMACAELLFEEGKESLAALPQESHELRLELLQARVFCLRLAINSQSFADAITHYLKATEAVRTPAEATHRCTALSWFLNAAPDNPHLKSTTTVITPQSALAEAIELAERFPTLYHTPHFASFLFSATMTFNPEVGEHRMLRQALQKLLTATDPAVLEMALCRTAPVIYLHSTDPEEIREGIALAIRAQEEVHHDPEGRWGMLLVSMMITAGEIDRAGAIIDRYAPKPLRGHFPENEVMYRLAEIDLRSHLGEDPEILEAELRKLLREYEEFNLHTGTSSRMHNNCAQTALRIGISRGNPAWGRKLATEFSPASSRIAAAFLFEENVMLGNREGVLALLESGEIGSEMKAIAAACLQPTEHPQEALNAILALLHRPVAGQKGLKQLSALLGLLGMNAQPSGKKRKRNEAEPLALPASEIQTAMRNALEWCIEKRMPGSADPILAAANAILTDKECRAYGKRLNALRKTRATPPHRTNLQKEENARINIRMIGVMMILNEKGNGLRIPGVRVRRAIGVMIANELMRRPLPLDKFREIATGIEANPGASANYLRIIVSRLRQIIGKEAIISDGKSAPRFNLNRVRIDIIEAAHHLDASEKAIRSLHPYQASQGIFNALELLGGEALYPTLYDDFFDAARLDFESRLRETLLAAVRLLCRENDHERAEKLLRLFLEQVSNDEEIAEELVRVLRILNRNVEALTAQKEWIKGG